MVIVGLTERRRILLALLLAVSIPLTSALASASNLWPAVEGIGDVLPQLSTADTSLDPALADGTRKRSGEGFADPPKAASVSCSSCLNPIESNSLPSIANAGVATAPEAAALPIRAPPGLLEI